jgi:hypothetical protein
MPGYVKPPVNGRVNGTMEMIPSLATQTPLTIKGAVSQTANLLDIKNSAGTTLINIDSSGRRTELNVPSFNVAKADNGNSLAAGDYPFDLILSNNGNHYSTSTYRFTAPVSGNYFFTAGIQMYGLTDGAVYELNFKKNGSNYISTGPAPGFRTIINKVAVTYHNVGYISGMIPLAVNDYVTVYHGGFRGMQSHFSGFLVG